jgi:hypothetical protein
MYDVSGDLNLYKNSDGSIFTKNDGKILSNNTELPNYCTHNSIIENSYCIAPDGTKEIK